MNLKHIISLFFISALVTVTTVNAQKKTKANSISKQLEDIKRRDIRNFGTIIENDVLVGYYMFSRVEKTGGGMAQFKIDIFDENLKSKKTIKLERSKAARLVEMNYNGSAFFLMLTNKKGVDMITYDKEGKKLGDITIKKVSKWEKMRIAQNLASEEGTDASVYSSSDQGFIRQTFVKNKKLGFVIESYSNNLKLLWSYKSNATSPKIEMVDIMYTSGKYIALLKAEKKNLTTRDVDNNFVMLDAENGDEIFEIPMKEISDLSVLGCDVNEEKKQIILNGEYFAKGKNIMNSKSEGLYLMLLDMSGKQINLEKMSWKKDLLSVTAKDDEKGNTNDNMRFYIHKVFVSASGNTYVVAEQYKKVISASAVAMKMVARASGGSSNVSSFSIKMYNMVYLVFDKDFKLVEKEVVKKKFSEVWLPKGYEYSSATLLAHYLKANGMFDYQFSTFNKEKGGFTSYYLDLNRKGADGKKNDAVIGSISMVNDKVETKRNPINTEYSGLFIFPATEGNILIGEHWRSKSKFLLRVESIQ